MKKILTLLGFRPPISTVYAERPSEGEQIEMTWLPNPRNHPNVVNAYIGMSGKVDGLKDDGSFFLMGETSILVVGTRYKFKRIQ